MVNHKAGTRLLLCAAFGATLAAAPAAAESVEEFYSGRTVTLLAGTNPGGSYGLYGDILGTYMSAHIPGKPTIIMNYMPGASGAKAASYLYNVAPKDGSYMLLTHAIPLVEKLVAKDVKFESAKMIWLGAFSQIAQLMTVWHTAPATTLEEMKKTQLIIGAFAKSHPTFQWPALLNNLVGTKFKIITGYRGGAVNNVAMERGEIDGWTPSWANLNGTRPQWLRDNKVRIVVQFGMDKVPELKDVPSLRELVPEDKRDIVDFMTAATPVSRAVALPPGVPADRVAALRVAFAKTMKDEGFLAECRKHNLTIRPRTGEEVKALVEKIVNAPPELIDRVNKALDYKSEQRTKG